MNSFKLNVAHLTDLPTPADIVPMYEVEVFHMIGLVMEIKARPVVFKWVNGDKLVQECQNALDNQLNQTV